MPDLLHADPGGSAWFGLELFDALSTSGDGNVAVDSGTTIINPRSIHLSRTSGAVSAAIFKMANAGRRLAVLLRTSAMPASGDYSTILRLTKSTIGEHVLEVRYKSDGRIAIRDGSGGTVVDSASAGVIAANTNYIVAVSYVIASTTSWTMHVWVGTPQSNNLTLAVSATNADFTLPYLGDSNSLHLVCDGATSYALSHRFEIAGIDDGTDLAAIGDIACTAKLLTGDSSLNSDTSIGSDPGSGNRYQSLDDRPLDIATGRRQAASSQAADDFTVQASSVGDVNISSKTIVGCGVLAYAKRETAGFVNFIGESQTKGNGTTEVMSGAEIVNGVVSTGDTIFVNFHGDTGMTTTPTIACVGATVSWTTESDANNSGNVRTMLFRGEVTSGGTLTSITVSWTTNIAAKVMQAARYRFVGTTAATSTALTGTGAPTATDQLTVPAFGLMVAAVGIEDNTAPVASNDNEVNSGINTTGSGANSNIGGVQAYEENLTAASVSTLGRGIIGFSHASLDYALVGRAYNPLAGAGTEKLRIDGSDLALTLSGLTVAHSAWRTSSTYPSTVGVKSTGNAADTYVYELAAIVVYNSTAPGPTAMRPPSLRLNQAVKRAAYY